VLNAFTGAVVIGGGGALSYLAAAPGKEGQPTDLRLSIWKGSLVGDVRFLGAVLTGIAGHYGKLPKKQADALKSFATAMAVSLASTEAIRYRMVKEGKMSLPAGAKTSFSPIIGAIPQFGATQPAMATDGAWAHA